MAPYLMYPSVITRATVV